MIENVSTQLTVFHCLCPLPASRKGLRLPLRSALFGEGGRDWRPCSGVLRDYSKFIKIQVCPRILETLVVQSDHSCWNENYVTKVELDPLVIFKSSTYVSFESSATTTCYMYLYVSDQGCVAQSVTCLTANPGVASLIASRSHTFVEIDH